MINDLKWSIYKSDNVKKLQIQNNERSKAANDKSYYLIFLTNLSIWTNWFTFQKKDIILNTANFLLRPVWISHTVI